MTAHEPAVWFPAVRTGTGTDVFTERLAAALAGRGIRSEITWLPLRAEYLPWMVPAPATPSWANIVHVNTWLHPRFIPEALPVVATVHHSIHDPVLLPYKGWLRGAYHRHWIRRVERATMHRADTVVAVSRFAADTARKYVLDRPMEVVYNGIDTACFHPPAERLPHHPFRLLYVGSWMARKGVDLLAPIMRELGEQFELRYTGGSAARRNRNDMPLNMHDLGKLDEDGVVAAMQQADALLFPSRSEGFGLVAAEAMACGLPVVATRGSAVTEVVEDDVTGVLCPRDDVTALVTGARSLSEDRPRWERLSVAGRALAIGRFAHDKAVDAYLRVYRNLPS